MGWDEVKKINSDNHSSLNHMIWINDYKTYTTNSYVYNNAAILDELLSDYWICINDMAMRVASFKKAIEKSQVGKAITAQSNIEGNYSSIKTLADLYATTETELIDAMLDSTGKLQWLTSNSLITIPPSVTDAGLSQGKTSLSTTLVNAWAADSAIVAKYTADVDTWYSMTQTYQTSAVSAINTQTNIKKVVDNSTTKTITSSTVIPSGTKIVSGQGSTSNTTESYTSSTISLTGIRYVILCSGAFTYSIQYFGNSTTSVSPSPSVSLSVFGKYSANTTVSYTTYGSDPVYSTVNLSPSTYSIIPISAITTTTGTFTVSIYGTSTYNSTGASYVSSKTITINSATIDVTGIV